jgi:hypothetical protein
MEKSIDPLAKVVPLAVALQMLCCSEDYLRGLMNANKIKSYLRGTRRLVFVDSIDEYLEEQKRAARDEEGRLKLDPRWKGRSREPGRRGQKVGVS